MSIQLSIEVTFSSDWGVGTGTGRGGDVDKVIAKDRTGLPMVPGKTLTGVLRDACEEAAYALDGRTDGQWHEWLRWLFGDEPGKRKVQGRPWPAALSIRPGTLGTSAQSQAQADPRFAQAAVVIRPGVAINSTTGVAKDDSLRMEERALSGLKVVSPSLLNAAELPREARVLLVCGARLVERIGGKRRRGAGRCAVTVSQAGEPLTAVAEDFDAPGSPHVRTTDVWAAAAAMGASLSTYSFEITCLTPVVASAGVKGNAVESLDYIPGYLLFPLVARRLGGNVADLITSGRIRVSDATPAPTGRRLLPVPLCLAQPKGGPAAATALHNALRDAPDDGQRYVPIKRGWFDPHGVVARSSIHGIDLIEQAHAVIDDDTQRPTERSGGLFVQQAIPAGTVLHFEVDLPIAPNLEGTHAVGRSKKDDYGRIEIRPLEVSRETSPLVAPPEVVGYVESDVLLVDETLTPTTSATALAHQIADRLGVTFADGLEVYHAVRRHETWSARWGLPRPSLVAIKAGTVIRFRAEVQPGAATIHLGERQAEGFGRVLVNPAFLMSDTGHVHTSAETSSRVPIVSVEEDDNSRIINASLHRRSLSDAVRACDVATLSARFGLMKFSNSQLGLLRELLTVQVSEKIGLRGDLARKRPPNDALSALLNDAANVREHLEGEHDPVSARRLLLVHCIRHARMASDRPDGVRA